MYESSIFSECQIISKNNIENYLFGGEARGKSLRMIGTNANNKDSYHIILIISGKCSLTIKRNVETYYANNIVIIHIGIGLSEVTFSDDFHGMEIIPSNDLILDVLRNRNPFPGTFRYKIHSTAFNVEINDKDLQILSSDMRNLIRTIGNTEHHYIEELNYAYFYILLMNISNILWHRYGDKDDEENLSNSRSDEIFKNFFDLLLSNVIKETNISFYADELCVSVQYLSSIVKKITDTPIGTFILKIRYEIATRLLMNSSLSIQQIAANMNFVDQSAFGKFFKKRSGLSPKAYRKSIKKTLLSNLSEKSGALMLKTPL